MRQALRIIRSMFLDFAFRFRSNPDLIHASTLGIAGLRGAMRLTPATRGPTPQRSSNSGWAPIVRFVTHSVVLLSLINVHASGAGQSLPAQNVPTITVERDGDTFHVRARASLAVDPRIAWDTITDYENMRQFVPNIERSKVVARNGSRVIVEHIGQFPLFFFDIPVRVRLAVQQTPYERIVARSEPGEVDGAPQTLRSFSGSYDLTVVSVDRRAGVRLQYESQFELAEALPPIVGDLFGTAMVTKTVRAQFEALLREMTRRQAGRPAIEKAR